MSETKQLAESIATLHGIINMWAFGECSCKCGKTFDRCATDHDTSWDRAAKEYYERQAVKP